MLAIILLNGCLLLDYILVDDIGWKFIVLRTMFVTPLAVVVNVVVKFNPRRWIREGGVAVGTMMICFVNLYVEGNATAPNTTYGLMCVLITVLFADVVMRIRLWYAVTATAVTSTGALWYLRNPIIGNKITTGFIDPAGLDYFKLYPAPNSGGNGYTGVRNQQQYSTVYDVRVDYHLNEKNLLFAKYIINDVYTISPGALPISTLDGFAIDPQTGNGFGTAPQVARNATLVYTRTFTPNLLMTIGAGWSFIQNGSLPLNYGLNPNTQFGQPNVNISQLTSSLAVASPTGLTGLGGGGNFVPLEYKDNNYILNGGIIYSRGNHSFRIGAADIRRQALDQQDNQGEGSWTFRTGAPGLLEGIFSAATRSNNVRTPNYRTSEPSVYFQDDWHVFPKLTLNLGLRYDVFTPFTEIHNNISNFDPSCPCIIQAGVNGVSRSAGVHTDYRNAAPRLGFAYSATPSLVVRGGFGLAFFPSNYESPTNLKNQPNVSVYGNCSTVQAAAGTNGCSPAFTLFKQGMPLPNQNPSTTNASLVGSIPAVVDKNFGSATWSSSTLLSRKTSTETQLRSPTLERSAVTCPQAST